MKIRSKIIDYEKVLSLPVPKHRDPMKPLSLLRGLIRLLSIPDMLATKFTFTQSGMEKVGKQPCLILMNHSSFIDLKIAYRIFFPRPLCIISTRDSYIGKRWLMPLIGCIPTHKFVPDLSLMTDIGTAIHKKRASVLMFPEAGYSLDGCATALPEKMGMLVKRLGVPLVTVITDGAFLRQPLYNELIRRKVKVSAHVECLLTPEEIKEKSVTEIDGLIARAFSFDNFAKQRENNVIVDHVDRAKGIERVLYRCPNCDSEGFMNSKGHSLSCERCGAVYEMDTLGRMNSSNGAKVISHVPDWVKWERECVRDELASGKYRLEAEVDIGIIKDHKALYKVGSGVLTHTEDGFSLVGCDGRLSFSQGALNSHSINADFYWYTIGDIICIGNKEILYYCFIKDKTSVFKARLAAEEIYKSKRAERRFNRARKEIKA